jgi:hypothetical protein
MAASVINMPMSQHAVAIICGCTRGLMLTAAADLLRKIMARMHRVRTDEMEKTVLSFQRSVKRLVAHSYDDHFTAIGTWEVE